jgi:predicted ATPase/DNA-binding SARP family transcriptional activator
MEYRLLGELEVVDDDGRDVPIRGAKQRALLLALVVRANESVPAERLADELWGEDIPAGGANALQAQVSSLRRALGPAGGTVVTGQGGYRLEAADEEVDARRFEALAAEGRQALDKGATGAAVTRLGEALGLWRGPALDGTADEGLLRREADRLDELRWTVREDRLDALLREGGNAELVADLQALVAEAPLRERLHGFLMLALYRAGRQADALRAFQDARTLLDEELGLAPGTDLTQLEAAILAHDPSLLVDRPTPGVARRTNLTPTLSSFIGRDDDLATLTALVDEHRLVTIVGPGGAGKTRLAQEAGLLRQADVDVWLVELAAVTDPTAVDAALATTLGMFDSVAGTGEQRREAALDRLAAHLGDRPTLVILDNCEHVIAEAATAAEHLLRACPALQVLATSREALGIGGETLWAVPPLSTDDAIQLFTERAEAVGGLVPEGDGDRAMADLCVRLDGMPLAIELAAARSRSLPVEQLAARLDDRFRLLTGGARTALPRQQTLRAVVEWSYDLLFHDEQEVFNRFSVFAGGCSLDAAETVCAGGSVEPEEVADVLARLVDKSLIVVGRHDGVARYDQLQTLALYGRERLAATDEAAATRDRHAAHYRDLGLSGRAALRGTDQRTWLAAARHEVPNVRVALAWFVEHDDAQSAHELAGGVGRAFWHTGGREEGVRLFDTALACAGEVSTEARATTLMWSAAVRSTTGTGIAEATAMGEEAFALWATTGDDLATAEAGTLLGGVHVVAGALDKATATFDQVAALLADREDPWGRALATSAAGRAAINRGDLATAEVVLAESVENFVASGAQWAAATGWSDLGIMANMRGDHESFGRYTELALQAAREMDMGLAVSQLLSRLGNLAVADGDEERADALFAEGLAEADAARSDMSTAYARLSRCVLRRLQGRIPEAREDLEAALVTFRQAGVPAYEAHSYTYLGFIAECDGDLDEARRLHHLSLERVRVTDDLRSLALTLDGLAGVAMADGDLVRSAELLGRARRLRLDAGGTPIYPRSDHDRIWAEVQGRLDPDAFADAVERGGAADVDDLV